jgi:hypothetical protein
MSETTPSDPDSGNLEVAASDETRVIAHTSADTSCLNCNAPLAGQYCWQCGQRAANRLITLRELVGDLFDALLDIDSRLWQSLVPLVFRPGKLTVDYLAGRRARYIAPFRMYLVTSVIFFLVAAIGADNSNIDGSMDGRVIVATDDREDLQQQLESLREELGDEPADMVAEVVEGLDSDRSGDPAGACERFGVQVDVPWLKDRLTPEVLIETCERVVEAGPAGFSNAMTENLPATMFIFLPLIAIVLKLLYLGSGRYFVEHLLFLLHYHAFFFVLFTGMLLATLIFSVLPAAESIAAVVGFVAMVYVPVYLFKAMRTVYGQGALVTTAKYMLLGMSYFVFLIVTFVVLAIYTALTL